MRKTKGKAKNKTKAARGGEAKIQQKEAIGGMAKKIMIKTGGKTPKISAAVYELLLY